jgi:hypothetical protein
MREWNAVGIHGLFLTNAEAERTAQVRILERKCV